MSGLVKQLLREIKVGMFENKYSLDALYLECQIHCPRIELIKNACNAVLHMYHYHAVENAHSRMHNLHIHCT